MSGLAAVFVLFWPLPLSSSLMQKPFSRSFVRWDVKEKLAEAIARMQVIKKKCRDPEILTELVRLISEMNKVKKLSLKRCRQEVKNYRACEDRAIVKQAKKEEKRLQRTGCCIR